MVILWCKTAMPLARVWQTLETRITRFRDFKCGKIAGSLAPPPYQPSLQAEQVSKISKILVNAIGSQLLRSTQHEDPRNRNKAFGDFIPTQDKRSARLKALSFPRADVLTAQAPASRVSFPQQPDENTRRCLSTLNFLNPRNVLHPKLIKPKITCTLHTPTQSPYSSRPRGSLNANPQVQTILSPP